jgi:hypothetical protein
VTAIPVPNITVGRRPRSTADLSRSQRPEYSLTDRLFERLRRQHPFNHDMQLRILRAADASLNCLRQRPKTPCQQLEYELYATLCLTLSVVTAGEVALVS